MENETLNTEVPPETAPTQSVTVSPNVSVVGITQSFGVERLFTEATKYTVFGVFALYCIGFIVWHSYLGTFGVSSIGFLQTEYLSAAFCYICITTVYGLAPAFLYERWRERKEAKRQSASVYAIILGW